MRGDVIISAGGVSVGEEDYVKEAVEKVGRMEFWKVAIKPGKPLAFGHVAYAIYRFAGQSSLCICHLYDSWRGRFCWPASVSPVTSPRALKGRRAVC